MAKLYADHFESTNGQVDVFSHSGKLLKTINVPDATKVFDILIAGQEKQLAIGS